MDPPGCLILWASPGLPIRWAAGVIALCSAGLGFPMSPGAGCHTITAAGIAAQSMDGVGCRGRLFRLISGPRASLLSTADPVGFRGVHWDLETTTMSITITIIGEFTAIS
jgi:hypothetical protein